MLSRYIRSLGDGPLAAFAAATPWDVVAEAPALIAAAIAQLGSSDYAIDGEAAIHRSARLEPGAALKGPVVIGPQCFVAAGALLRGGVWLGAGCVIGPSVEIKASLLCAGVRLAHFNFVGESILGADVNVEAGAVFANTRNERAGSVRVCVDDRLVDTGRRKFGALVGDGARIGANAVLAPGTLLAPGAIVARLALVDQEAG